jgi:hypothetical protein
MLQVSQKFKNLILGPHAFAEIFEHGCILVYAGVQPDTADESIGGATLLAKITSGGGAWSPGAGAAAHGLQFILTGQFVARDPAQTWIITPIASGLATWFRLITKDGDAGDLSFDDARIDGAIGMLSSPTPVQMILANPNLVNGVPQELNQFVYTIPPIYGT